MASPQSVHDGVLLQSRGTEFGEAVYLARRGKRHYISSAAVIEELGFRWPDDVVQVPPAVLKALSIGGGVPHRLNNDIDPRSIQSSGAMREYMARDLTGLGLEVGAGASPFPVPLECRVLYGDKIPHEKLVRDLYPGQQSHNLVMPDILTDFDTFQGIADNSLDFIIGCHVIEHCRNPIGSIVTAHRKLKSGGKLLLVVPDKERTFDKDRPVTSLDHLLEDFTSPDRERDFQHYEEFFQLAFPVEEASRADAVRAQFERDGDLHFHVWDYPAFMDMIDHIQSELVQWSSVWSHPSMPNRESDIEFYVTLTK